MLRIPQILVNAIVLGCGVVSLSACGQQGPLYLPTKPVATKQSTSPENPLQSSSANSSPTQTPTAPAKPTAPAAIPASQ